VEFSPLGNFGKGPPRCRELQSADVDVEKEPPECLGAVKPQGDVAGSLRRGRVHVLDRDDALQEGSCPSESHDGNDGQCKLA